MSSSSLNTPTHSECGEDEADFKAGHHFICPPSSSSSPSSPISEKDFETYDLSESVKALEEKEKQKILEKETMETNTIVTVCQVQNQTSTYVNQTMVNFGKICPQMPSPTFVPVQNNSQDHQTNDFAQQQQQEPSPSTSAEYEINDDDDDFDLDIDKWLITDVLQSNNNPVETNNDNNNSIDEEPMEQDEDGHSLPSEEQSIPLAETPETVAQFRSSNTSDCTVPQIPTLSNIKMERVEEEEEIDKSVVLTSAPTFMPMYVHLPSPCDSPNHQHLLKEGDKMYNLVRVTKNSDTCVYEKQQVLPSTSVEPDTTAKTTNKRKSPLVERSIAEKNPRIEGECLSPIDFPLFDPSFNLSPPVKTVEELQALDKQIKTDETLKQNMIHKLSLLGGEKILTKSTNLILLKIMDEIEVGGLLNWAGRGVKTGLMDYKEIVEVIQNAVRRRQCPNATDTEIKSAMQVWLKNAGSKRKVAYKQLQLQLPE